MLKCLLPFSHSLLISFVFYFLTFLFLDKLFVWLYVATIIPYHYATSLELCCNDWLEFFFMYHAQNCFNVQPSTPFVLAIVIELDLLQHSILVLDLLQFCNIVCASLSFHSLSFFISNYVTVKICQRACMLVYNLYCIANLDGCEVDEN